MKKKWKKIAVIGVSCSVVLVCAIIYLGSFHVARLFQDNVVLQRGKPIPVWGWGVSGLKVKAKLEKTVGENQQTAQYKTLISDNGTWSFSIIPHEAGGPYTLTVEIPFKKVTIKNLYFGDVWLCAGQSNISMKVKEADNADEAINDTKNPLIMYFKAPRKGNAYRISDYKAGNWERCSPETVGEFSAVGYYFAKALQADMDVPISLLDASVGTSKIEAWMPSGCFDYGSPKQTEIAISKSLKSDNIEDTRITPTCLFNSLIYPAKQFPMKGVIWWQGESNALKGDAYNYRNLFPCLINEWREFFGNNALPFIYVQLANVAEPAPDKADNLDWPMLRESQSVVSRQMNNVAQVVSFDISDPTDIHPRNKQGIGNRLAMAVKKLAYGENTTYTGPEFQFAEVLGTKIILSFSTTNGQLMIKSGSSQLKGFTIAGADQIFYPASASIINNQVILWSEKVHHPIAARYAWERSPVDANLCNETGLPASPFRTDNW